MRNKYLKTFVNYMLNGLVIMLPVFGTGYIIYHLLKWLDNIVPSLWYSSVHQPDMNESATLTVDSKTGPVDIPVMLNYQESHDGLTGWGIILLIVILFLMGWLGSLFINDRIKEWLEKVLDRIPGVNNVYRTINDILGAFVGNKKKFNQPVLVKVSEQLDMEMVGFITDTDLIELGNIPGKVAVYFPMSYSFAGHMMIVPVRNIKRIESNPVDVMKYTVSGGIVEFDPDDDKRSKK